MRVTLKSLRIVSHLVVGLLLVFLVKIDGRGRFSRENLSTWWHRVLLRIFEIKVTVRGTPLAGTRVIVCNHISWLDITLVAACEATRFVSKAEVADWPIAGWLVNAAGTFYIRRGAGGTKQLINAIDEHLGHGSIVFFPEGTTTDGSTVLKFQPRLFATAIETNRPVQPVALRYGLAADGTHTAPFVGDDDMVSNILRLLRHGPITAELIYCEPISPAGCDRATLAQAARDAICAHIAPTELRSSRATPRRESLAA